VVYFPKHKAQAARPITKERRFACTIPRWEISVFVSDKTIASGSDISFPVKTRQKTPAQTPEDQNALTHTMANKNHELRLLVNSVVMTQITQTIIHAIDNLPVTISPKFRLKIVLFRRKQSDF
jgi:hypothetical protein